MQRRLRDFPSAGLGLVVSGVRCLDTAFARSGWCGVLIIIHTLFPSLLSSSSLCFSNGIDHRRDHSLQS